MSRRQRLVAALSAGAVVGSLLIAPASTADPAPPPVEDYCGGQCHHVLPPGQNGNATLVELAAHMLFGTRPKHSDDQIGKYESLVPGYKELTTGTIGEFFNDNSFGVPEDQVERRYQPRSDVTIVRDKKAGIPHVYGTTRAGTAFGAGFATAEDKLFLMDVMRRAGRGQVTPFAGGAEANRALEQGFFATSPYTEEELWAQIINVSQQGERGRQALADAYAYLEGINAYIAQAYHGRYFPGEYVATGHVDAITNEGEIEPFRPTDLVVLASLVGAQFGGGGGNEVQNAVARMALHERFGPQRGEEVWRAFRAENDPEAISTVHDGRSFPYAVSPENPQGAATPDPGSVTAQQLVFDETGSATRDEPDTQPDSATKPPAQAGEIRDPAEALRGIFDDGVAPPDLSRPRGMSNALMVSGAHTESGHPVAVFGPQTGYFAPQLLTLQELQGPGISSKGASFAGLSFYTLLGRGQDYAWSATTAAQDIIDTYAVELCDPDGGPVTKESDHYLFRGECLPMRTVERTNEWKPNLGDDTPAGSYRLVSFRTRYGPVTHRATIGGKPVAYTTARSTFMHEVDSIIGFQKFNDPSAVNSAESFQRAAHDVNYTFNWFYADANDTAYFNSGDNLVRPANVDPSLPVVSDPAFEWKGWDPATNNAEYTPFEQHPNSVNQDYYISWNNKQAPGTSAAKLEMTAVQRGDLLDGRVRDLIAGGGKVDRVNLTQAMADAGVTDLRAERVLPDLLRVIDSAPVDDPGAAALVEQLRGWTADGGKRAETKPGSRQYAHAEAIELMDAWWPLLVRGQFEPALGTAAYRALTDVMGINESPSGWQNGEPGLHVGQGHQGSAFQHGWFGQVSKDIRGVLGDPVDGGFGQPLCGGGDLPSCRQVLLDTLRQAAAVPAEETYPGDADCEPGDQWCADSLVHNKIGGIGQDKISWQNRPTYQQVVEFPAHR
ncbi:penicillin amidase [Saccharopolyspora erythraea NRRL 2338]|uniref:Penicillin acylase n=2 Tax=Saccharopolyspora erythraea TaxID=1836 RepID=A4F937_SACEN|nr:penicillin acylase family protein [Saccharopolyspora erythraea]AAL78057.1 ORFF [Saccharopolyspora erythraea]EQD87192.1 penicillin acylase [Saccharopolyspora erythraea D]PFG94354.1 penicillin amidase [Saccharopolyspora erythraea NRRL 2338]QRK91126.1 penicillin acylase family protein [Saccharopolyspora erythraea]CAM00562.1 penicillin acylase [Saccharopolyspora erythraea NRRL 2338]